MLNMAAGAATVTDPDRIEFLIPSSSLAESLRRFSRQAHMSLVYSKQARGAIKTQSSSGLKGMWTVEDGLRRLLRNSGYHFERLGRRVLLISADETVLPEIPETPQDASPYAEIVVTALKRETTLLSTPMAISVIDDRTLASTAGDAAQEISRRVPGLSVIDLALGQRRLAVRGIQANGENQVGLYYGSAPVPMLPGTANDASSSVPPLTLDDVDRVEVLKGPQGSLFGAGSMAGTVRVIPAAPLLDQWQLSVGGGYQNTAGGDSGYRANIGLNLPLLEDRLSLRLAASDTETGGYIDNVRLGEQNINRSRFYSNRIGLRYEPDHRMRMDVTYWQQSYRQDDASYWLQDLGAYHSDLYVATPQEDDLWLASFDMELAFEQALLTIGAARSGRDVLRTYDNTAAVLEALNDETRCEAYFATSCSPVQMATYNDFVNGQVPTLQYQPMSVDSHTLEVRLADSWARQWHWTVGVFAERRDSHILSQRRLADAYGQLLEPEQVTFSRYADDRLTQKALFGELNWPLSESLTFSFGGRYFSYRKRISGGVEKGSVLNGTEANSWLDVSHHESGWVFRYQLGWEWREDSLIYGQVAEGLRPGGANAIAKLNAEDVTYGADWLRSYELGLKFQRNGVLFNGALYRIDWQDMQSVERTADGLFSYTGNAGDAVIHGAEISLQAALTESLSATLLLNGNSGTLVEHQYNGVGRKGDDIPYIPHLTSMVALRWIQSVAPGRIELEVSGNYSGDFYSDFNDSSDYYEHTPSQIRWDLRSTLAARPWTLTAGVTNLFNRPLPSQINSAPQLGERAVFSGMPRTLYLRLSYDFR